MTGRGPLYGIRLPGEAVVVVQQGGGGGGGHKRCPGGFPMRGDYEYRFHGRGVFSGKSPELLEVVPHLSPGILREHPGSVVGHEKAGAAAVVDEHRGQSRHGEAYGAPRK